MVTAMVKAMVMATVMVQDMVITLTINRKRKNLLQKDFLINFSDFITFSLIPEILLLLLILTWKIRLQISILD